jgi:bla regulator protein BlaR1
MVRLWTIASYAKVAALVLLALGGSSAVQAQASAGQSAPVPEWQTAAGGKMAFDVASIRLSPPGTEFDAGFPLSPDDSYVKTGGNFSSVFPVSSLISFAYKLNADEWRMMRALLPKWANEEIYTVHARSENVDATKDQMRLMVQALLADRFKLTAHFEMKETAIFALELAKPGQTGPGLRPHGEGPPCDKTLDDATDKPTKVFPEVCDVFSGSRGEKTMRLGSRNTTMELLASSLDNVGRLGRPVVDRTGLAGRYDFVLEYAPQAGQLGFSKAKDGEDAGGTTFLEALKEQLGLKLEATKAPEKVLVVDRVERPSEN